MRRLRAEARRRQVPIAEVVRQAVTRRRLGVEATIALLDDVLPTIELLPVDAQLHAQAQQRYRATLPTGTSFVDHVSFAVMEREGIATAFVLDADFAATGVQMLP
jgi:predicted nucleic acid-binding protein